MAGRVSLIGAGPGDPGLITLKAVACLGAADVVLYDRLVNPQLLDHARHDAELVFVGKGPGERAMEQEDINEYLVARALEGKVVARLKGGDPFVFGRGGEEAQELARAGVEFEVVPGLTSAIAAPAYAGIPVTHRGVASSFTVVTGNEDPSKKEASVQWETLARLAMDGGTLVVLMGWGALDSIARTLVGHGLSPSTTAALVQWGTRPYQRTVTGPLEGIAQKGREAGLTSPVVAVIGPVAGLRDEVRWYDARPLFGKRVLVTRSRAQASALSQALAQEGAQPTELPTIHISPMEDPSHLDAAISDLGSYRWAIFTSVNGVEATFARVAALGLDSRAFGGVKVGAIGPATAAALARHGIVADLVPKEYVAEALLAAMAPPGAIEGADLHGARVLLPRAEIARDALAQGLEGMGAIVDQVAVYRTTVAEDSRGRARDLLKKGEVDVVTFTSSSTVRNLLDLVNGDRALLADVVVACIGPITAGTARELGLRVDVVTRDHTIPGLVQALAEHYATRDMSPAHE